MQRAANFFNAEQRQQITRAVAQAESGTSCEIVPVVATVSGRYERPEDIVGLWLAALAGAAVAFWYPPRLPEVGHWGAELDLWLPLIAIVAAIMVAFVLGALIANRIGGLRRLFTPRAQMRDEVNARSRQVFFDQRVYRTEGDTGVLIYVSLYERMAVVLASQAILDKLGVSVIEQLCQQLTAGLRQGKPLESFCGVIEAAGRQLSGPWPRTAGDVNELPDALVILD